MRITIAGHSRFYLLDLARQLLKRGHHLRLCTALPQSRLPVELRGLAVTNPFPLIATEVARRAGYRDRRTRLADAMYERYARWLARVGGPAEMLDALNGWGFIAGPLVQNSGGVWVCNSPTAHISFHRDALAREHARWGLEAPYFSRRGVDRLHREYEQCDLILTASEFARRTFIEHGTAPAKLAVAHYGVDLSLFRPDPVAARPDVFTVVFVGALSAGKGIGYLLEAARPLVEAGRIRVWLVGPRQPSGEPILNRYRGMYTELGHVPNQELAGVLRRCSALVQPSVSDSFSLVVTQAMACGLPVVVADTVGAADFVSEGVEGYVVPSGDAEALRDRLDDLVSVPGRAMSMGTAAAARAAKTGGWDMYGNEVTAAYARVLDGRGLAVQ